MENTTAVAATNQQDFVLTNNAPLIVSPFSSIESFSNSYRMSKCLAASTLVPDSFMRNEANCMIALELAARFGYSPFMIMQNLFIIHGRPGFSSQFIIAAIQSCGRYSALHYRWTTDKDGNKTGCRAEAKELATGEILTGAEVTLEMAKKEGWSTKTGSKWLTMPEQMMMYRAAAFFGRLYAPDILLGIRSDDELIDMDNSATPGLQSVTSAEFVAKKRNMTEELNAMVEPSVDAEVVKESSPVREEPKLELKTETKTQMKTEEKSKTESKLKTEQTENARKVEAKTTENPLKTQSKRTTYEQPSFDVGFNF